MNKIFEKNLSLLKEKHPKVYETLKEEISLFLQDPQKREDTLYSLEESTDGTKNLRITNERSNTSSLFYQKNPYDSSREVINKSDLGYANMVFLFGFGLGYLANEYLKVRDRNNYAIILIEPDARIFLHALAAFDASSFLSQPGVHLLITEKSSVVSGALYYLFQEYTTVSRHIKILAEPTALELYQEYFKTVAKAVMSSRDLTMFAAGNSTKDSYNGFENTVRNLDVILSNPGYASLIGSVKGSKVCVSVAAGPQLNDHWDTIKSLVGKVPIIASETLVKPMSEREIYPDFYTALERDDYVPKLLRGFYVHPRTTLFCPTLVHPETLAAYHGETLIYRPMPAYTQSLCLDFLGPFYAGSSSGNVNIGLALALGFETVIMVGHNLAYSHDSRVTHVSGTIDKSRETTRSEQELKEESKGLTVISQDGETTLATRVEWQLFRGQIESLIVECPQVRFINTAAKGARIAGAELMSLQDALKETVKEDFDFYPLKRSLIQPVTDEVREARRKRTSEGFQKMLDRFHYWRGEQRRILNQLKKWKTKIEDRELQGKRVSIDFLNECLEEVLKIKVRAVNEDEEFHRSFISLIFSVHVTFEREINAMLGSYTDNYLLKRDFLLSHIRYFETWEQWLPKFTSLCEEGLAHLQAFDNINRLVRSA